MKILNYSIDDYYLQLNGDVINMAPIPNSGVSNVIQFVGVGGGTPSIIEDSEFLTDNWTVGKQGSVYRLIQNDKKRHSGYNVLQVGLFSKDGVTPFQSVMLYLTKKEFAEVRVLAAGNAIQYQNNNIAMSGFFLVPATARYIVGDCVYSCATDRVLSKWDYNAELKGTAQGRRLISATKFVIR